MVLYIFFLLLSFLNDEDVQLHECSGAHDFHLSNSTLNYNSEEGTLQITINMFIDDLELALAAYGADSLKICTRFEREDAEEYIYGYILNRLIINVDGSELTPFFVGKEQSEDLAAVWCYLEVPDLEQCSSLEISNTIMTDLYDDQKNLVTIQRDKKRMDDELFTVKKTSKAFKIR